MRKELTISFFFLLAAACGSDQGLSPDSEDDQPSEEPIVDQTQNRCAPATTSLARIADVVALINALPKPVSLECVVSSLKHPLQIQATTSVISAQPATSREKPRIFLQSEGLFLSVVPGSNIMEFGETWQSLYSIKGELAFPVTETLSDNAPYLSIGPLFGGSQQQTRCGAPCHGTTLEYSKQGGTTIFASQIIRPNPAQRVQIEELRAAWNNCQAANDPACQLYDALFKSAEPVPFEFNESFPYF